MVIGEREPTYKDTVGFAIDNSPKRSRQLNHVMSADRFLNKNKVTKCFEWSNFHFMIELYSMQKRDLANS